MRRIAARVLIVLAVIVGIVGMLSSAFAACCPALASPDDLAAQLERLAAMRDNGTLTEADFTEAKAQLLVHSGS